MKRILSILAIAAISLVNAQEIKSSKGENYLPEKGDWAIGFNADRLFEYVGNSFNGNTSNSAPSVGYQKGFNGNFVGKYFTSEKNAYRVVFNLQLLSNTNKTANTIPDPSTTTTTVPATPPGNSFTTTDNNSEDNTFNTNFSIGVGKEWRRGKTRLQGFYGADVLLIVTNGSSTSSISSETNTKITTPAQTIKSTTNSESKTKNGVGFGIGAQGFIGAEYFIFPKMAIGAQYTYGVRIVSQSAGKTTTTTKNTLDNSLPTPTFTSTETNKEVNTASNTNIGLTGVGIVSINLTLHF